MAKKKEKEIYPWTKEGIQCVKRKEITFGNKLTYD